MTQASGFLESVLSDNCRQHRLNGYANWPQLILVFIAARNETFTIQSWQLAFAIG